VVGVNDEIFKEFEKYRLLVDEHVCGITLCNKLIMKGTQGDI
jgi:hypothetical protein